MRTTLTLDPDVVRLVNDAVHRDQRTMKDVINEALRQALREPRSTAPYILKPHHSRLRPGVDPVRLNQLADELSDDAQFARVRGDDV